MNARGLIGCVIFSSILFFACKKEGQGGDKPPQITFLSSSPNEFKSGSSEGKITINFRFFDANADLGNADGTEENIFITTNKGFSGTASLPQIPDDFKDPSKGIDGTATVVIPTSFFVLDSAHLQTGDTFQFSLYIKDNALHPSNTISTADIYIRP